ncbi:MAG: HEAT repeat domain-containing protein, partial [Acidobacteria bacterium]|nr:HEAT repeat domain-containing protein [Acidobacteriota bacterium]
MTIAKAGWLEERYFGGDSGTGRAAAPPPELLEQKRYAPDKAADILHIKLEVAFDLPAKAVIGRCTTSFSPLSEGLSKLELDCAELTVDAVADGEGRRLAFDHDGSRLAVLFPRPLPKDKVSQIVIAYHGRPRAGLYFTGPTKENPRKAVQVWSQGQDEDSRHWFPCFDYPNEKATSETIVTVPENWTVVANGELVEVVHDKARKQKRWHHRMNVPHVSYLISVACGEFIKIEQLWRNKPVQYFVKPGQEAAARRAFARTPDMLEYFSERFGVEYPYPKYSQVVVEDFIFGGMENISATTLIDRALPDARAALDFEPEDLVSHELAHQWFGDLVTCKDWSHAWLNEGFASYAEVLYREHWRGEEDATRHRLDQMQAFLARDKAVRRPTVTREYAIPMQLFDAHIYEKGSLVLHMLRHVLGEAEFWAVVTAYLKAFAEKTAQTEDLIAVIERVTGKNLEWFFDQWVFGAGYPELEVKSEWDENHRCAIITVDQKQKLQDGKGLFRLPFNVRFHGKKKVEERSIEATEAHHQFTFPLEEKPDFVRFDPGCQVVKKTTLKMPASMLKAQLERDPDWTGRAEAAHALGKEGSYDSIEALGAALLKEVFWGATVEIAAALGENGSLQAREALMAGLSLENPKARRAVVKALGTFRDEVAAKALSALAKRDASYFVEAEANLALGATRQPSAFAILSASAKKESHGDVIRELTYAGLARLRDDRALPILRAGAAPGGKPKGRMSAMRALATLAKGRDPLREEVRQELEEYLRDSDFFAKMGALAALEILGEAAAADAVDNLRSREVDGRLALNSRDVARRLRESTAKSDEITSLRSDFEKLREENRSLRDRVEKIEKLSPPSKPHFGNPKALPKTIVKAKTPAKARVKAKKAKR